MPGPLRILYIDANVDDRPLLDLVLRSDELRATFDDVRLEIVAEAAALASALADPDFDIVVIGDRMGWVDGLELIGPLRARNAQIPVLLFAQKAGEERVLTGVKHGLGGYLEKTPAGFARLPGVLKQLLAEAAVPPALDAERNAEQHLLGLLGETGVAHFRCNADGRLLHGNDSLGRLFGLGDAGEREGINLHAFSQQPGDWTRLVRRLERERELKRTPWPVRRGDGAPLLVSLNARLVDAPGGAPIIEGLVEIPSSDGGPERAETMRRLEELEHANAELRDMASIASHELQEPLRTVERFTKLLRDECRDKLNGSTGEFMHFILEGTGRMQRLVDDFLKFSRIGRADVKRGPVDGEQLLRQAKATLAASIEECGATITHDPLPQFSGDAAQLGSLMENLIGNALKFRGNEAPAIHVSARQAGGEWTVAVTDNGIGIAPADQERVFDVFCRLPESIERPGTGIGLALCKRIVEGHGGRIWIESQPGEGTTILFSLPQAEPIGQATARAKSL